MITSFVTLIESLGVSLLEFACIVYIFKTCLLKPILWFIKKTFKVDIK